MEVEYLIDEVEPDAKHSEFNHFRGKCGEVLMENGHYIITCDFCTEHFESIKKLSEHLYKNHLRLQLTDELLEFEDNNSEFDIVNLEANHPPLEISVANQFLDEDYLIDGNEMIFESAEKCSLSTDGESDNRLPEIQEDDKIPIAGESNKQDEINKNLEIPTEPTTIKNENGLFQCSFCTRLYFTYKHLKNHFLQHTDPDQFDSLPDSDQQACNSKSEFVDDDGNDNDLYEDEISRVPNADGEFHCKLCGRKYMNYYNYRTHFMQNHKSNLNQYKCPDCPMTFAMRHRLLVHMRTHTGEKPYKCQYCPRAFSLGTNLTRHVYIHLGKKPYACSYCDMRFTQQNCQKAHERNIHTKERPYQCEICGRAFSRPILLSEHFKRHTNTRTHECEYCSKKFFNNTLLKIHLNIHTAEKTFECKICNRKFTNVNSLRNHKKLHSDSKQYTCNFCDKKFAQNAGLYGHIKSCHGIPKSTT